MSRTNHKKGSGPPSVLLKSTALSPIPHNISAAAAGTNYLGSSYNNTSHGIVSRSQLLVASIGRKERQNDLHNYLLDHNHTQENFQETVSPNAAAAAQVLVQCEQGGLYLEKPRDVPVQTESSSSGGSGEQNLRIDDKVGGGFLKSQKSGEKDGQKSASKPIPLKSIKFSHTGIRF